MAGQIEIMKLMIGWTLVGAFIFTVVVTCLSMIGVIRFADKRQQSKLFGLLIVELVGIGLGVFTNLLNISPAQTIAKVQAPLANQVGELKADVAEQRSQTEATAARLQESALEGLQPEAAALASRLVAAASERGIELRLITGYLSPEQQLARYARGRTASGPIITSARVSVHSTGLAFDVAIMEDGKLVLEGERYATVGKLGRNLGLVWGGEWRAPDLFHFETVTARTKLNELKAELARDRP